MDANSGWSHHGFWPAQPENVFEARQFVADHLRSHQLSAVVDDARLVVSELATNALRHAGTSFSVTVSGRDDCVEIEVGDGDATWVTAMSLRAADFGLGGRGLRIVGRLSADWGVRPRPEGGKSVWAVLPASRGPF